MAEAAEAAVDKTAGMAKKGISFSWKAAKVGGFLVGAFALVAAVSGGPATLAAAAATPEGIGLVDLAISTPIEGIAEGATALAQGAGWVAGQLASGAAAVPVPTGP